MRLHSEALEDRRLLSLPEPGSGLVDALQGSAAGQVVARHIFYNGSRFDGYDSAPGPSDDLAIAPNVEMVLVEGMAQQTAEFLGKRVLLPGESASFQNYTSYSNGINGIMVDLVLAGAPEELSSADFRFRWGNDEPSRDWPIAPQPQSITVRPGAGERGSDRVTLIWRDREIVNTWLEVTVRATAVTGLDANDVFYWGNAVGESGNVKGDTAVDEADRLSARNDPWGSSDLANITNPSDFNRDGRIDENDEAIVLENQTGASKPLMLFRPSLQPAPVARVDMIFVNRGDAASGLSNGTQNVLANDRYFLRPGNEVSVSLVTPPSLGTLTLRPDGTFLYQHDNSFGTLDIFTYKINDGERESAAVPVVVSIIPSFDGAQFDKDEGTRGNLPDAVDDEITVGEGGTATRLADGAVSVLANDANVAPLSPSVTVTLVSQPRHGALSLNPDGTFTYRHDDTENFADGFTYRVRNGTGESDVASVTIRIVPNNDNTPVGKVDFVQVAEGQTVTTLIGGADSLLRNDVDADLPGDVLTVSLLSPPANGTLSVRSDGTFTYSLVRAGRRTDFFTYTVSDGVNTSAPVPVVISIAPPPAIVPVANNDVIGIFRGGAANRLNGGEQTLLDNDENLTVFDSPEVVTLVSGPRHGTLTLNPNGTFRYEHDGGNDYTDEFTYRLSDGVIESNIATVTVNIAPIDVLTGIGFPLPPRRFVDTTYRPPQGGVTWVVNSGDNLQSVLDTAQPGDIIELQAGATFQGGFTLRKHSSNKWIYIRSSAHEQLPPAGSRVTPDDARFMPKLVASDDGASVIAFEFGAGNYRLSGLEITKNVGNSITSQLVSLSANGAAANSVGQLPHDIIFDRVYVHGTATDDTLEGIRVDGINIAVIDSHISDIHSRGFGDTQAILGVNSAGPIKIVNNYLEAAGENVMFGGGDPRIRVSTGGISAAHRAVNCVADPQDNSSRICGLVPSDIEIRGNHFFKPLSWRKDDPSFAGIEWPAKNLFELKNAQRVIVEGNVFQNSWPQAQLGFALVLTPRNQQSTAPWSTIQDLAITKNVVINVANAVALLPTDNGAPSDNVKRVLVRDNLFQDVEESFFEIANSGQPGFKPAQDIVYEHNTALHSGSGFAFLVLGDSTTVVDGFIFRNNLMTRGRLGLFGSGASEGTSSIDRYLIDYHFQRNAIIGGRDILSYPWNNFHVESTSEVGFADYAMGDYRLDDDSRFAKAGTDGKALGADMSAVAEATAGVVLSE